jgi:F0F1-type ATP synthase membrane subunit c/vacuolar-type H+-ATPase subunit K
MLQTAKTQLPQVRALMAQKDTPGTRYSPETFDRIEKTDLSHEINATEIVDLSENEIDFLRRHIQELENDFTQAVYRGEIPFPVDDLESCLNTSNPLAIELRRSDNCQYFNSIVGIRVDNMFARQNRAYQDEYNRVISANPMLSLLRVSHENSDEEILQDIQRAINTLYSEGSELINHIKTLEGDERRELFSFEPAVNNYLETNGVSQHLCDISQDQRDSYDFSNLRTDLYIGAGALVGGGVCAFTAGLGCALGVAIGAEALAIGVSQNRLNRAQTQFYTGMISSETMQDREFERNLSLYLAPLALVGHGAVTGARRISENIGESVSTEIASRTPGSSMRSNFVQRQSLDELNEFLGDNKTIMLTRYFDGEASELSDADQIHFASIAELLEQRARQDSSHVSQLQLEQGVKRQIDEIMNRCR